jgi:hypothetical protein
VLLHPLDPTPSALYSTDPLGSRSFEVFERCVEASRGDFGAEPFGCVDCTTHDVFEERCHEGKCS